MALWSTYGAIFVALLASYGFWHRSWEAIAERDGIVRLQGIVADLWPVTARPDRHRHEAALSDPAHTLSPRN